MRQTQKDNPNIFGGPVMSRTCRLRSVPLAVSLVLLLGCGKNELPKGGQEVKDTPAAIEAPSAVVNHETLQKELADQIAKQMAKREEDLEKQKLVLLVDGIRDNIQHAAVKEKAGQLIESKGNYSIL